MLVINKNVSCEIEIKKSRFICLLFYVESIDDINSVFEKIKGDYKDATHYCYAYILNNQRKFSDDNEPSGTAGLPMLNVLEKNNLTNIIAIVIRYFGGIKLGAGGLVRAYSKSVSQALKETNIIPFVEYEEMTLETSYDNQKLIDKCTKDVDVISKEFKDNIKYIVRVSKDKQEEFKNNLDKKIKVN